MGTVSERHGRDSLLVAAKAWCHPDDWGVADITFSTLESLSLALDAGDAAMALRRHAKHAGLDDCVRGRCDVLCYAFIEQEAERTEYGRRERDALKARVEEAGLTYGEGRE